jgi:Arc/MetJ-type ribon-helix-helix transcriptional regulator
MSKQKLLKQQVTVSVTIEKEHLRWLQDEARRTDNSVSRVVREAVRELQKQRAATATAQ